MLFILATRWADDIRSKDQPESRPRWHHISWPFKPQREPENVHTMPPDAANILTAIVENERIAHSQTNQRNRAIGVTWLFHLVGDIHQPMHTISLFTREYPNGDRGGNEMCVLVAPDRAALSLHRLWDGLLTSSNDTRMLRNMATELRSRFPRSELTELASTEPEAWAKDSFEIATKIAYQNGALRGTPKGQQKECREVSGAQVLPASYAAVGKRIAERRMMLAGYRLASLLEQINQR